MISRLCGFKNRKPSFSSSKPPTTKLCQWERSAGSMSAAEMLEGGIADEDCDDMVNLSTLNADTILRNLECRFGNTKPYTYVGRIVISTNPFQWIDGLYSDETIVAYSRAPDVFADLSPHVYSVARDALDKLSEQQVRAAARATRGRARRSRHGPRAQPALARAAAHARPSARDGFAHARVAARARRSLNRSSSPASRAPARRRTRRFACRISRRSTRALAAARAPACSR
jgi:hypothetical protein